MDNNWNDNVKYAFLRRLGLSHREVDVAKAMLVFKTDAMIGEHLHISCKTVHTHRLHIYKKTNTHDRAEFIMHLVNKGWLEPVGS